MSQLSAVNVDYAEARHKQTGDVGMTRLPASIDWSKITETIVEATIHLVGELEAKHRIRDGYSHYGVLPDYLIHEFTLRPTVLKLVVRRYRLGWYLVGIETSGLIGTLPALARSIDQDGITLLVTTDDRLLFWFDRSFWAGRKASKPPTLPEGIDPFKVLWEGPPVSND